MQELANLNMPSIRLDQHLRYCRTETQFLASQDNRSAVIPGKEAAHNESTERAILFAKQGQIHVSHSPLMNGLQLPQL